MRVVKTEVLDSTTGELIAEKTSYGVNNGGGWVICYRVGAEILARRCDSAVTFRVFHLLISRLDNYSTEGVVCSRKWLQDTLGVSRKSIYNALQWLIANDFLVETTCDGFSEFYFNPSYVTIGKNKTGREKRWAELKDEYATKVMCKVHGLPYPLPVGKTIEKLLEEKYSAAGVLNSGDLELVQRSDERG